MCNPLLFILINSFKLIVMNKKENYETFRHATHYVIISSFYMDDKKDFDICETFRQYHTLVCVYKSLDL